MEWEGGWRSGFNIVFGWRPVCVIFNGKEGSRKGLQMIEFLAGSWDCLSGLDTKSALSEGRLHELRLDWEDCIGIWDSTRSDVL
jgi:hypothetical protein